MKNRRFIISYKLLDKYGYAKSIHVLKMHSTGEKVEIILDYKEELLTCKFIFVEYQSLQDRKQRLSRLITTFEHNRLKCFIEPVHKKASRIISKDLFLNIDLRLHIFA